MSDIAQELVFVNLEDEMRQSYLDYAMSVIIGRALPDVRDGLKPVHRRVLYTMEELGNDYNKAYKKSARVVGDVMGKYHPHGDSAIYDAMVRMAQPFSMRYMLIDGQGNFGSVDGDAPAAMRYTEVRMAKITQQLLADIDKDTVDFVDNYDGTESEPSVLPTRVPALLINGSSGIAVGMATNIPPHNLGEVIAACLALLDNDEIDIAGLMEHMPGPDFPTAGIISGAHGIYSAYKSGRGRVYVRGRTHVEPLGKGDREAIIITELPYQVNKARLVEKIADLVREKKIDGISELRDESDKDGMRVVIELKRGEITDVVLNNLYKHTALQSVFGINMVALHEGQPKLMSLRDVLDAFISHRREVITRRTLFELSKARDRAHVLEGQTVALANIDPVIELIKASPSPAEARAGLVATLWAPGQVLEMLERAGERAVRPLGVEGEYGPVEADGETRYRLSDVQAKAILDLQLQRLTGLEQEKIIKEYSEILDKIKALSLILSDPDRLTEVVREELEAVREEFADERRTEIVQDHSDLTHEDLIPEEDVLVTLSHGGYAKAQTVDTYQAQRRGGRGRAATAIKDDDFIDKFFIANTHDTLLCFSSRGMAYWLKVYQVPQAGRGARGKPLVNLLPLQPNERINAVLTVRDYEPGYYVFFATSNGTVKRTPLDAFSRPRASGIIAIDLRDDDRLVDVALTTGDSEIMLVASSGKSIRFGEQDVRAMGRTAAGVRGIRLAAGHEVIALLKLSGGLVLTATENGFGKRTRPEEFSTQGRGGQGIIAIQTSERNGRTVGAMEVGDDDEVMFITANGTLVRTPVSDISVVGRNTQGVRLIRLDNGDQLAGMARIAPIDEDSSQD